MKEFPSIKDVKLTHKIINQLKGYFKWATFCEGISKISETKSGGVYGPGETKLTKTVTFEIKRNNAYVMITLIEYKFGLIFHAHSYFPHMNRVNIDTIKKIYLEVIKILKGPQFIFQYEKLLKNSLLENYLNQIQNDKIENFLGPGKSSNFNGEYDNEQLRMGIEIEYEHTNKKDIAERIAKDHLAEIPDYYTRLKKMEEEAE